MFYFDLLFYLKVLKFTHIKVPRFFRKEKTMREEKVLLNATLCFPIRGDKILLARKTKKIGQGCWNGYGGGIEDGETPEQSMIRELEEESGVIASPEALEKMAIVDSHNTKSDGGIFVCRVHVYFLHQWAGEFEPTEEMVDPTWFDKQNLPFAEMMPADKEWLPLIISGQKIIAEVKYSPFQQSLLSKMRIQRVNSFN